MHVGFARVIWAEYIVPYSITDRGIAPESGVMQFELNAEGDDKSQPSLNLTPKALAKVSSV